MTYGNTYASKPENEKKMEILNSKKSLVEILCKEYGYNREGFNECELEVKFDINYSNIKHFFEITENIELQTPYIIDKILPESSSTHSCYAYLRNIPELAFTQVNSGHNNNRMKLKIKGKCTYETIENIIILKRSEEHIENATSDQTVNLIKELHKKENIPIAYMGVFDKISKEFFTYNNNNGRIFVVALNVCKFESKSLVQAELEYYGRVNILKDVKTEKIFMEMSKLSKILVEQITNKGYNLTNSIVTKFDWLTNKQKES